MLRRDQMTRAGARAPSVWASVSRRLRRAHPRRRRGDGSAPSYRIFLTDGTALVSFGEFARANGRIVFTMPIGSPADPDVLQVVTLPDTVVDWDRYGSLRGRRPASPLRVDPWGRGLRRADRRRGACAGRHGLRAGREREAGDRRRHPAAAARVAGVPPRVPIGRRARAHRDRRRGDLGHPRQLGAAGLRPESRRDDRAADRGAAP